MAQFARRTQSLLAVYGAKQTNGLIAALGQNPAHQRRRFEVLPDHRIDMRVPRQHRSVAVKHGNRGTVPESDRGEELFKTGGIDPPRHHPEKSPVRTTEPVGENGGPVAGEMAAHRLHSHRHLPICLEVPEIGSVLNADISRRPRPRRIDRHAIRSEDEDVAAIGQGAYP